MAVLSLSRIFLYNWHRFSNHVLPVTGNLYLTGENGTGKSTILDALQLVLIGDLTKIHFNQAAQNERTRSSRNLATYVLGKNDETFLRTTSTIAYVVLEFADEQQEYRCAGVCIEVGADRSYERTYFLLSEELSADLFVPDGKPLRRSELRNILRSRRAADVFDQGEIKRYQAELLNRLGGLNDLFFELLGQALTFKPINNIHEFVSKMILPAVPIELKTMQEAQRNVQEVEALAEHACQCIEDLKRIGQQQQDIRHLRQQQVAFTIVRDMLRRDEAQRNVTRLDRLIAARERELGENAGQLQEAQRITGEAEQKRDAAFQRLAQSESKQQRDLLTKAIEEGKEQVQAIEQRWERLQTSLHTLGNTLQAILVTDFLSTEERESLRQVFTIISELTPETGISQENIGIVEISQELVDSIKEHIRESLSDLRKDVGKLRERGTDLEQERDQLERENTVRFHPNAERLRSIIWQRLGIRPAFVCELLDVPDSRWQDAVEAQLGMRRFAIVVPPERFDDALAVLDDARAAERIYGIRLLDITRMNTMPFSQALRPESLAYKVETVDPAIRIYINMVLGNIMTCERREQLRQYRHAITPQLLTYSEASVYAIDPNSFKPHCIGSRAKHLRLTDITEELENISERLGKLVLEVEILQDLRDSFETVYKLLLTIQPTFSEPLDKQPLLVRIQEHEAQLRSLDLDEVRELEDELEYWRKEVSKRREKEDSAKEKRTKISDQKDQHENEKEAALNTLENCKQVVVKHDSEHPGIFAEATQIWATFGKRPIAEVVNTVEQRQSELQQEVEKKMRALLSLAIKYNMDYAFRARTDIVVEETAYENELQRLEETELPRQQELITKVRRETENQLRQDILHRIAEQFERVNARFNRINAILAQTSFHNKQYRLVKEVRETEREYYDIIRASETLGEGFLYETLFYQEHQEACERFFDALLKTPRNDEERETQERLVDYRHYFDYDILITDLAAPEQPSTSLARTLHQRSGGETQTPFYVAIAASFASLYKVGDKSRRSTIRLAIFDEAFSKMDQRYIGSTLEVFRRFGLQIVTATPPDRCPYLGPRMDTSLVLVLQGNIVRVEPLRRYLAALEEMP